MISRNFFKEFAIFTLLLPKMFPTLIWRNIFVRFKLISQKYCRIDSIHDFHLKVNWILWQSYMYVPKTFFVDKSWMIQSKLTSVVASVSSSKTWTILSSWGEVVRPATSKASLLVFCWSSSNTNVGDCWKKDWSRFPDWNFFDFVYLFWFCCSFVLNFVRALCRAHS